LFLLKALATRLIGLIGVAVLQIKCVLKNVMFWSRMIGKRLGKAARDKFSKHL
jgi:hypothetical protein